MKFFNKVVSDFDCSDTKTRFSNEEMLRLMEWQTTGAPANKKHLVVLIQRHYLDKVQINLFEGGHGIKLKKMVLKCLKLLLCFHLVSLRVL